MGTTPGCQMSRLTACTFQFTIFDDALCLLRLTLIFRGKVSLGETGESIISGKSMVQWKHKEILE